MNWDRLAGIVLRRPGRVLAASLLVLVPPALAVPSMRTSLDELSTLPESADSVRGYQALQGSFAPGRIQPLILVVDSRRTIWNDAAFGALDDLTVNLEKVPGVASVRSITRPTEDLAASAASVPGLGDVSALSEGLPRATDGLGRAIDGLERMRDGLREIVAGIPERRAGLREALDGVDAMRSGLDRIIGGVGRIARGVDRAGNGLRRLADEVADPTLASLRAAWGDLRQATTARSDPQYPDLVRHVGRALGAVSGRCPDASGIGPQPPGCPAGQRVEPGYNGLGPTLREIATGLERAEGGLGGVAGGLGRIDDGLAELGSGIEASAPEIERLAAGAQRMIDGLDRIIPGLTRLRKGLAVGTSVAQRAGLLPDPSGDLSLTASLVRAFPSLQRRLALFVGDRGRATRLFVTLEEPAFGRGSLAASRQVREVSRLSVRESPLEDARLMVAGSSAFFADVADFSSRDLRTIVWAVVLGIFLVLALLLRSLIAPLYLVATVLLSFLTTLGLAVIVFQGFLGEPGLVWWLPSFLFVILVALGADYNIFLTSRIREEAGKAPTREAVAKGLAATGHVITSAGLILAGTFAALMAASLDGMVQMGFAATAGILIDTFIVRSLLVPSIAVLVGSWSWWPSARARLP